MPVNFTNPRNAPVTAEVEKVRIDLTLDPVTIDIEIPKVPSLPYGLQSEILMLYNDWNQNAVSSLQFFSRVACIFSQMNPPAERLDYQRLTSIQFPPNAEGLTQSNQLSTALMRAGSELFAGIDWGAKEGNAPKEKAKDKN